MTQTDKFERPDRLSPSRDAADIRAIYPQAFSTAAGSEGCGIYLADPLARRLADFFQNKGLAELKAEDRREQWYEDWLVYQAEHQLYARLISPKRFSAIGGEFELLRYCRFLELFAYFSPAHGYSLQCTFLGLFPMLMGSSPALKREAIATLEAGGLFSFAVSEKDHGSDLLANEFTVRQIGPDRFVANGTKYYIGNSNSATIISILARMEGALAGAKRAPLVFLALRPKESKGFHSIRKIHTLGVRAGFVGEFEIKDHEFTAGDLICDGRRAWDAVLGTVTLGKFFLGFGSIGICEHAFEEAAAHLRGRLLYGKRAIDMPHLRLAAAQAYTRLSAMKLYAYRALDYVQAASAADRRYLLFAAVQKAKVSTEGVKVMALLSECIGAKAFEADTYFEMALRDAQLFPSVEGSTHVNLGLAARFIPRYFSRPHPGLADPRSLVAARAPRGENAYLMEAHTGGLNTVAFGSFQSAYRPLMSVPNVRSFVKQVKAFRLFLWAARSTRVPLADVEIALALGQCLATIAYAQLIAENAALLAVPRQMVSAIFQLLVCDLTTSALNLASFPQVAGLSRILVRRLVVAPGVRDADWDWVSQQSGACSGSSGPTPTSVGDSHSPEPTPS